MRDIRKTLIVFPFVLSCGSPDAKYADAVAKCELAATCAEAVLCRVNAAIEAGRDPKKTVGHCEGDK